MSNFRAHGAKLQRVCGHEGRLPARRTAAPVRGTQRQGHRLVLAVAGGPHR